MFSDNNTVSLDKVIDHIMVSSPYQHKYKGAQAAISLKQMLAPIIQKEIKKIFIHRHKLFVYLDASALKHELQSQKEMMLQNLKKYTPSLHFLEEIIFI